MIIIRKITISLIVFIIIVSCVSQNHASKGWKYLDKNDYTEAKKEFEVSLNKDTLPGSLSGMAKALEGLNEIDNSRACLILLLKKFPDHRFTPIQIEMWNKRHPDKQIISK